MALPNESDLFKGSKAEDGDGVEVDLGGDVELEIIDDTPEKDRGHADLPAGVEIDPTEDELGEYSDKVKARISKMTKARHDERRGKEQAIRERDEAVAAAQRLFQEKKQLEARNQLGEDAFLSQAQEKINLKMGEAKRAYKAAYEVGDADKMADAQEQMAVAATERKQAEMWAQNAQARKQNAGQEQENVVQSAHTSQAAAPRPDEDAIDWAEKNKWFGQNNKMTQFAYGVHADLIEEGIDPKADAGVYYQRLNKELRTTFPDYEWGDTPKRKVTSVVAPVNRTSKTKTKVTLTQSQVAVAKRMGVSPLQYAIELAKLEAQ